MGFDYDEEYLDDDEHSDNEESEDPDYDDID